MSGWVFLALFFGVPIVVMAFAARAFRRFCLILSLPLVVLSEIAEASGPDSPMVVVGAIPHAVLLAAILVEIAVLARRFLGRRLANG